ncbi:transposase [Rhodococcus sp. ZPP]|nr:transposase [Rhodococcus sp. ZPP]
MGNVYFVYPPLSVDSAGTGVVSHAGAVLLLRTAEESCLTTALSSALEPWHEPTTSHNPGKIITDLTAALALGGDCLAEIALLREEPAVFGRVTSDPTVSRLIATLAADAPKALAAFNSARSAARRIAWITTGEQAPARPRSPPVNGRRTSPSCVL